MCVNIFIKILVTAILNTHLLLYHGVCDALRVLLTEVKEGLLIVGELFGGHGVCDYVFDLCYLPFIYKRLG